MKKVILTGFSLMAFAAASFAQNVSTVNQNGTSQTGNATQVGNVLTSNIQQSSSATITNVGNYANTSQKEVYSGFGSNSNEAFINQIGTKSGFANIGQEGNHNASTINQKNNTGGSGTPITAANAPGTVQNANNVPNGAGILAVKAAGGNYANTYQRGANEQVTVNQNDNSTGNYADSRQDNYGTSQKVTIDQNNTSTNNSATANQFGDNNKLSITQSDNSSGNTANVRQGFSTAVGGPNAGNATATVEQNGGTLGASSSNSATVLQTNFGANDATIRQNNNSGGVGQGNDATVTQSGLAGSTASVSQSDFAYKNFATVDQSAAGGHTATVRQNGNGTYSSDNNSVKVDQTGSTNQATVDQLGVDINGGGQGRSYFNKSFVTQSGINNKSFVEQNDFSFNNLSTITQAGGGAGDLATTKQNTNSFNNTATVNQGSLSTGGNTASILQQQTYDEGGLLGNTASIKQNVTVAGGGNTADIIQGNPSNSSIGSGAGSYSNNNQATMDQEGSSNAARMRQEGDLNIATVMQNGNNNVLQNAAGVAGSFASQTGVGNTLMLTQNGPGSGLLGNIANVTQVGTSNASTVAQSLVP